LIFIHANHHANPKQLDGGFATATCYLPDYEWTEKEGFSDKQMKYLQEFLESTAHIIIELARTGWFYNAF
jgi:hypothetical protein